MPDYRRSRVQPAQGRIAKPIPPYERGVETPYGGIRPGRLFRSTRSIFSLSGSLLADDIQGNFYDLVAWAEYARSIYRHLVNGLIRIRSLHLCRLLFRLSQQFFQYLDSPTDAEQGLAEMTGFCLQFFKPFLAFLKFSFQFRQAGAQLLFHVFYLTFFMPM